MPINFGVFLIIAETFLVFLWVVLNRQIQCRCESFSSAYFELWKVLIEQNNIPMAEKAKTILDKYFKPNMKVRFSLKELRRMRSK
jgi:hypothetical protein